MSDELVKTLNSLSKGKYRVTLHAQKRMWERKISHADIRHCGMTGIALISEGKIGVKGYDCDGEKLVIICVLEDDVLIITVF